MVSARPNIVWICVDDFTPDVCGTYGNRVVRTPNIDRLADQGMRFDRAYCCCPLSTPSRQSFWTGRYPRSIGVTLSPTPLPIDEVTLPVYLRRAGYHVAALGKTHFYSPRRYEFDVSLDWPDYEQWLSQRRRGDRAPRSDELGPWRPFADPARIWLNSDCLPYAADDAEMFSSFLTSKAAVYLQHKRRKPFFLYLSFYETHSPFWFPREFRGRHQPGEFSVPALGPDDDAQLPPVFRELTTADKQGILAAYATSTEFVDKNVGIVLDALDRSGLSDNTLVIFTSDHGYLLGQHGRFEKHSCFEPAIRVAMIMRLPGVIPAGKSSSHLVQLIDLLPTLLELAGAEVPCRLHGQSLRDVLNGQADRHRSQLFIEYAGNEEAMVRTDRWKLIYRTNKCVRRDGYALDQRPPAPGVELYDLQNDLDEFHNLARDAEHALLVEELLQELTDHLVRTSRFPIIGTSAAKRATILERCLIPAEFNW